MHIYVSMHCWKMSRGVAGVFVCALLRFYFCENHFEIGESALSALHFLTWIFGELGNSHAMLAKWEEQESLFLRPESVHAT